MSFTACSRSDFGFLDAVCILEVASTMFRIVSVFSSLLLHSFSFQKFTSNETTSWNIFACAMATCFGLMVVSVDRMRRVGNVSGLRYCCCSFVLVGVAQSSSLTGAPGLLKNCGALLSLWVTQSDCPQCCQAGPDCESECSLQQELGGSSANSFLGRPRRIPSSASDARLFTLLRYTASCRRHGSRHRIVRETTRFPGVRTTCSSEVSVLSSTQPKHL